MKNCAQLQKWFFYLFIQNPKCASHLKWCHQMLQNDVIKCCKMMSPHSNEPATWRNCVSRRHFCSCILVSDWLFLLSILRPQTNMQDMRKTPPSSRGSLCVYNLVSDWLFLLSIFRPQTNMQDLRKTPPSSRGSLFTNFEDVQVRSHDFLKYFV